jgi:hypothetical protein
MCCQQVGLVLQASGIKDAGLGLFTDNKTAFPAGEYIMDYEGVPMEENKYNEFLTSPGQHAFRGVHVPQLDVLFQGKAMIWNASTKSLGSYINDYRGSSLVSAANVELVFNPDSINRPKNTLNKNQSVVEVWSSKKIKGCSELFLDYGEQSFWSNFPALS